MGAHGFAVDYAAPQRKSGAGNALISVSLNYSSHSKESPGSEEFVPYWANCSRNSLSDKLIREGDKHIKQHFEELIQAGAICTEIDKQIVYSQLDVTEQAYGNND